VAAGAGELSEREIEVLRAMRDGKSNKEIAGSLFVAPSTVKTHLKNIFLKLDVNNRVRAVTRAVESGILR
jgi:DNA-binding NarL/FixJ family response regulator